jgi:hypothetical protein
VLKDGVFSLLISLIDLSTLWISQESNKPHKEGEGRVSLAYVCVLCCGGAFFNVLKPLERMESGWNKFPHQPTKVVGLDSDLHRKFQ